jgi:3-hydroxy acid dehydrogenase / malonic semialdehyde reductase
MKRITMITGATAGIGKACAWKFSGQKHDLILTGRRADRLEALAEEIRRCDGVEVYTLVFDVRERAAVKAAWESLPEEWRKVSILVNNAGLALGREPLHEGDVDEWDAMIDTNLKGLLYVTKMVLPGMVAAKAGHVINLGSVAGREVYPNGNVYCATKFAVEGLSRALRLDVAPHGIKVTTISPGLVETEFSVVRFKGDQEKADAVYQGIDPLTGEDIAEMVWFAASQPAHICINDINLTCSAQANVSTVIRREGA